MSLSHLRNAARPNLRLVDNHSPDDPSHVTECRRCAKTWAHFDQPITPEFTTGALLFVQMLEEVESTDNIELDCELRSYYRLGRYQRNLAAEYLDRLPADPETRRGFTALMSTYICDSSNGCGAPKAKDLRRFATIPAAQVVDEEMGARA